MKQISIIGGGLTGLSLGIALRNHAIPVRVFEAGSYPRHRVCGEFINGVQQSTLNTLGISHALDSALLHRAVTWFNRDRKVIDFELPEPARGISRFDLDHQLAARFQALQGELLTTTRITPASNLPPEASVWTTGRIQSTQSQWIGLKSHFHHLDTTTDLEMHLGSGGYLGLCRVSEDAVNVCGLFHKKLLPSGKKSPGIEPLLSCLRSAGLTALASRLADAHPVPGSFKGVSAFQLGKHQPQFSYFGIGDSDVIIPPFTGNGMSMAFESAETAVAPLVDFASGKSDWQTTITRARRDIRQRFRTRLAVSRLLHPLLLSDWGQSLLHTLAQFHLLPIRTSCHLLR